MMSSQIESTTHQPHDEYQTSGQIELQSNVRMGNRMVFVDHIRVVLTILVVIHHLALTYGAFGGAPGLWYTFELTKDVPSILLLSVLVLIDQSFFMGSFFLLSGYFTPGSYDRKGAGAFFRDRLLRLGIPLVIFTVLINPLTSYFGAWGSNIPEMQAAVKTLPYWVLMGPGPLWFVEALLIFASLYAVWRRAGRRQSTPTPGNSQPPAFSSIVLFTLALAVVTFLVRLWAPAGWWIQPLNFQLAYFPQYISLFVVGLIAYRRNWFLTIPSWIGKVGLGAAIGATIVLLPLALSSLADFPGGLHWQAFAYALWEAIMAVGMSTGLLVLFRQRFNRQGRVGKFLSGQAYAVYIIHAPVITGLAFALRDVHLYPLLKLVLAVLIGIPLCFGCGYLLRRLPFARKIL